MSESYVGEIRLFGGNFAPRGWALCDGTSLSIAQNDTLFALIGTTYGGDGVSTFNLPDLRGRLPIHMSTVNPIGQSAGSENVTLGTSQIPSHGHALTASGTLATSPDPEGAFPAATTGPAQVLYGPLASATAPFAPAAIAASGGNQPHNNLQPTLCVSFIISLFGIYPSQS